MQTASRSQDRGLSSGTSLGHNSGSGNSTRDNSHVTETIQNLYVGESDQESEISENTSYRREGWSQITNANASSPRPRAAEPSASSGKSSHLSPSSTSSSRSQKRASRSATTDLPSAHVRAPSPSLLPTATDQFPLNDIEYESNPAAVAKELSNLQALRRMSMDASSTSDPDLPIFNWAPPTAADDEQDARRLFWVPASLHPELAPKEWKIFVESRVKEIRATGKETLLSPNQPSLRRKKSMLSRQIDTSGKAADQYEDGADRLEKRRSAIGSPPLLKVSDLENLVNDPSSLLRKLSISHSGKGEDGKEDDDDLILPPAPPGYTLKRSTRTYRRGGGGGVAAFRERGKRISEGTKSDAEDSPPAAGSLAPDTRLQRARTEPAVLTPPLVEQAGSNKPRLENAVEKGSKATKLKPAQSAPIIPTPSSSFEDMLANSASLPPSHASSKPSSGKSRRSTSPPRGSIFSHSRVQSQDNAPHIIETPPEGTQQFTPPERTSSQQPPKQSQQSPGKQQRPPLAKQSAVTDVKDLQKVGAQVPARSDSLPAGKDEKKDRGGAKRSDSVSSGRKSSWGWLLGDTDKDKEKGGEREKEKEKEKDKDKESKSRKKASKAEKAGDRDHARLDVLQKSIEGDKGKESREAGQPSDREKDGSRDREKERGPKDKEGTKKSNNEDKKERDGLFSSFFGSSRKKSAGDGGAKSKPAPRAASPDRSPQAQQTFYYTRFPIHIERAIYRLSHLKLANPRRPLLQQVLLSNFMYSYLAKVQMTQPHLLQQAAIQQQQMQQQIQQQQQQQQQQQYEQQYQPEQPNEQYYQYEDDPSINGAGYTEDPHYQYQYQQQMYEYEDVDPHTQPQQMHQHQYYQPRSSSKDAQYNLQYDPENSAADYSGDYGNQEAQQQRSGTQVSQRGYR